MPLFLPPSMRVEGFKLHTPQVKPPSTSIARSHTDAEGFVVSYVERVPGKEDVYKVIAQELLAPVVEMLKCTPENFLTGSAGGGSVSEEWAAQFRTLQLGQPFSFEPQPYQQKALEALEVTPAKKTEPTVAELKLVGRELLEKRSTHCETCWHWVLGRDEPCDDLLQDETSDGYLINYSFVEGYGQRRWLIVSRRKG
jgi:hypothetical protein